MNGCIERIETMARGNVAIYSLGPFGPQILQFAWRSSTIQPRLHAAYAVTQESCQFYLKCRVQFMARSWVASGYVDGCVQELRGSMVSPSLDAWRFKRKTYRGASDFVVKGSDVGGCRQRGPSSFIYPVSYHNPKTSEPP